MSTGWMKAVGTGLLLGGAAVGAQVTSDTGIVNRIPKYSGAGSITSSAITEVNGSVGIGTSSPDALFRVTGRSVIGPGPQWQALGTLQLTDSYPSVAFHFAGDVIDYLQVSKEDTSHNTFKFRADNAGSDGFAGIDVEGPAYFATSGSGNVGIGTTNPQAMLDVAGVINGRNYSVPATFGTASWAKIGTFTGGPGETIRITAYIHKGYNASNSMDSTYYINFKTSNDHYNGTVDPNGFAGNGSYYAIGYNNAVPPGYIKWVSDQPGIAANQFSLYILVPIFAYGGHYSVTIDQNASWVNSGTLVSADPGPASSTVMVSPAEFDIPYGNVGIGTASPQNQLSVQNGVSIDQGNGNAGVINNGANSGSGLTFGGGSGEGIASNRSGANGNSFGLDFYTEFARRMSITQSGNVGIGTTNPTASLEVNGGIKLSGQGGNGIMFPDNTIQSTAYTSAAASLSSAITNVGANVGIGTTTPSDRLSIAGGSLALDGWGFVSSMRSPANSFTSLLLGGGIRDNGDGTYTVMGDGGSDYFSAIRMDNSGGNLGAINFYSSPSISGSNYLLSNAQLNAFQKMTLGRVHTAV